MNVLDEVFGIAQKRFERILVVTATEKIAIGRVDHFGQPGSGPVFTQQASEDRLKVVADLEARSFQAQSRRDWSGSRMVHLLKS